MSIRIRSNHILAVALSIATTLCTSSAFAIDIIAHRGASGYLPEHTKEAVVLAFMQGADYIEQDLVLSKDNQLIVLHDIHLEKSTNVETVFPERKRADGRYYVIDFMLSELRQLSIHERQNAQQKPVFPNRYRGKAHYSITTFDEHVELIRELNRQFARNTGWYPEIKSPEWHLIEGKDIAQVFASKLTHLKMNKLKTKIFVQSFEPKSLQRLRNEFALKAPLIQLIADNSWSESSTDYDYLQTESGLKRILEYADGIGPWLPQVINIDTPADAQYSKKEPDLVARAKALGLLVHPYTLRMDVTNQANLDTRALFNKLVALGVDGVFTDQILPFMLE